MKSKKTMIELKEQIILNFYEYFLYEKKEIKETIQITSDGYLMRPIIELNNKFKSKTFEENIC